MNIQTVEVGSHWVFVGEDWQYTDDQKQQLDKAWATIDASNKGGVLRGLSYHHVIEPVVRNALVMHTNLDENALNREWDIAHNYLANCVYLGEVPTWKQVGRATKYRVGSMLCDTKEKAVVAMVQKGNVTPELLIELAEWLKEEK
jgi:hypothetical protein